MMKPEATSGGTSKLPHAAHVSSGRLLSWSVMLRVVLFGGGLVAAVLSASLRLRVAARDEQFSESLTDLVGPSLAEVVTAQVKAFNGAGWRNLTKAIFKERARRHLANPNPHKRCINERHGCVGRRCVSARSDDAFGPERYRRAKW